ncbi:class I SAM-dependent methyltransferase [Dolichospermum sp. ST_sed3]|nr:class I SAM-dependent methyltransferase [Dolichospermum sp. ST_sed3]
MKSLFRKLIPLLLLERYRRSKQLREMRRNSYTTTEGVFTEIYRKNRWGGPRGEFYSGPGSADEQIVSPYISMVSEQASSEGFLGLTFVDLGCGDFRVGRQLLSLCSDYTGVDIVKPLIRAHQQMYGNATTRFIHLDIVVDDLPNGDVCFVRQVLQHLSNQQIAAVLQKLKKYRWVFITEHYPTNNAAAMPNIDKVHGCDTRMSKKSGVYLAKPPFRLPSQALRVLLEVPSPEVEKGIDAGIIRTFLYTPSVVLPK